MAKVQQKYEININGRWLSLVSDAALAVDPNIGKTLILPYNGLKKSLFQYLDTLEKSNRFQRIVLYDPNPVQLLSELKSLCLWVPAAGGIIKKEDGKILLIYRKGQWDLPKGKLDPGEKSKVAAVRECIEETGLAPLEMIRKIGETWHLYRERENKRALKRTKWFLLQCDQPNNLNLQKEEGIEKAQWLDLSDALLLEPIYPNIKQLLETFRDQLNQSQASST